MFAQASSLAVVEMPDIKDQFWASVISCMKMPRGGVHGGGSQHCTFEFVAGSRQIVSYLMEDLPLQDGCRYNLSIQAPHWEKSPSISIYHALNTHLLDSYFRLHRRRAARGSRGYRGSVLAAPPDGYPASVVMLSACMPFLVELCHRKFNKLVLSVSFHLATFNDTAFLTPPPRMTYAPGFSAVLRARMLNHLKKMHVRGISMSGAFVALATAVQAGGLSDSEGEWVAPPVDLSALGLPPAASIDPALDSGEEADEEADLELAAAADQMRARGVGSKWSSKLRQ